jgi:hypothetical protein
MWRAYGNGLGVAIVMNNTPFIEPTEALNAWTSPVAYLDHVGFAAQLSTIADRIGQNASTVRKFERGDLVNMLFRTFLFAATSTKHGGFREEREWRVVHSPRIYPTDRLPKSQQVIRGIPQMVYSIPMKNYPEEGLSGAQIEELVDRIIIGPTDYGVAQLTLFTELLADAGVPNPEKRVVLSGVPLRGGF